MDYIKLFKSGDKIHIKPDNKGKFTESAKKAGKSVLEHAHDVVNNPNSTAKLRQRALFAINAKKWKHQLGGLLLFYIPKAPEGIKTDTILNTNLFLNTTLKELNKKTIETAEGKKYDLTRLLAIMAPGLGLMLNYSKLPNWVKKPLPEKEYNAKTF